MEIDLVRNEATAELSFLLSVFSTCFFCFFALHYLPARNETQLPTAMLQSSSIVIVTQPTIERPFYAFSFRFLFLLFQSLFVWRIFFCLVANWIDSINVSRSRNSWHGTDEFIFFVLFGRFRMIKYLFAIRFFFCCSLYFQSFDEINVCDCISEHKHKRCTQHVFTDSIKSSALSASI